MPFNEMDDLEKGFGEKFEMILSVTEMILSTKRLNDCRNSFKFTSKSCTVAFVKYSDELAKLLKYTVIQITI
ncbi:hypothetical protein RIR_jg8489.t1 [Rhizophagus irregularis DAOM 181602=DAOM 197198]|nr:hypothetical protein RIR_jg8489.t1 [Rhizophagus irregularis DAOM 181602=DAOM 197198]